MAFLLPGVIFGQKLNIDSLQKEDKRKIEAAINNPYQKFNLKTKEAALNNADLEGKVVFINFWHSQCPPCLAEMTALNNIYDTFKINPGFKFISFTFNDEKTVKTIKTKYEIKFPVYSIDGNECDRLMYYLAFPTNIILSDSGIVKYISPGASMDRQKNIDYFQKKLFPIIKSELIKPYK